MKPCSSSRPLSRRGHDIARLSAFAAMLAAAGCGGAEEHPVGTVTGSVTFKNKPVPEGVIYVYNKSTANGNEGTIKDGKFELLSELRTGTYTVFVTAIPPPPNPDIPVSELWGDFPTDIPEKYQRPDQSSLSIEVDEGENEVEVTIPSQ